MKVRFKEFDLNRDGSVSLKEFLDSMALKKEFYKSHYP
jgi:Ca2+-binding EF-hand superfamily protein